MRLLFRLAIRNWAARPGRAVLGLAAVTLGVALVVAVTTCYESLRVSLTEWVASWLSRGELQVRQVERTDAGLDPALADRIRGLPGVRLVAPRWRHYIDVVLDGRDTGTECIGIDPAREYQVRGVRAAEGRLLEPGDADAIMLADEVARALGAQVGDTVRALDSRKQPHDLTLVGTVLQPKLGLWRRSQSFVLLDTLRRLKPDLAAPGAHTLDIGLAPLADATAVERRIEGLLPANAAVTATPSQVRPIEEGMRLLGVILVWTAAGALMTAWFIIFATLDLGVVQRTRELGTLRLNGATRAQIAASVFVESMPLAVLGVLLGLPLGVGLAHLAAQWFETLFGRFTVSVPGLWFAALGGLGATALAADVPAINAARVSPVAASRPEARAPRAWTRLPIALGGAALFAALAWAVWGRDTVSTRRLALTVVAAWPIGLVGTVAVLPLVIGLAGRVLRRPVAWLLRLPARLTAVHLGRASWRSALVAGALAVGVSLVVNLLTNTESIIAGWALPRRFPGVALGLPQMMGADEARLRQAADLDGIGRVTPVMAAPVIVTDDPDSGAGDQAQFLGIDPAAAEEVIQLNFVEGSAREAFAALEAGGAVIVPRQFLRTFNTAYGETVTLLLGPGESSRFRIVGVVESAGIDLVQNYYEESGSFLQALSATVMIGSAADARDVLGVERYRLILFDFDLPRTLTDAERVAREEALIARVRETVLPGAPAKMAPAIRMSELKALIDRDFRNAILWVVLAAGVACVVAGLGVVNLMMANVTARAPEIAVLRGVGASRGMICRLIVAEGVILGVIGSGAGLLLGLYMAAMSNRLDRVAFAIEPRFAVPWPAVGAGLGVAVLVALLASILPAVHAARTNVAAALDAT